ncbi:MAG: biopolymer transporter ExbD [Candidatus Omnitrophica bacterium]|nr:biopolymer transporter ExbD [Candidatus Omnitrophota bacterium]
MQIKAFPSKRPRIEMVPLIDMFFLLLVFFIFGVFSMTMQQGLLVELPTAQTAVAVTDEETLTISLTAEGGLFVNRQPVPLAQLPATLRQRETRLPDPVVTINADRRVPHGTVMAVLDAVRQASLQRVSFQTASEAP